MKALGTGIKGFLGSNLAKKVSITPIPHKDILTTKLMPFDVLYFLSSYGNYSHQTDADKIMKANILDLIHIINQAVQTDFQSFVFISTSSVKLSIQTMYSRAKRAAEEILLSYMEKYKKPILIIRPFTICGVGDGERHLIPTIIRSCLRGEKIDFIPNPTHDYIDVEDVVDGIQSLVEHGVKGIFELGVGKTYTNLEVLQIIEEVTGKKANVNIVQSMRSYDNERWVSTNFKARGYGWLPRVSLKQSITNMVENYKKHA